MPFVRSAELRDLDTLAAEVRARIERANPGAPVELNDLASKIQGQVLARSAEQLLEGRRRERAIAPEVLAFRVS